MSLSYRDWYFSPLPFLLLSKIINEKKKKSLGEDLKKEVLSEAKKTWIPTISKLSDLEEDACFLKNSVSSYIKYYFPKRTTELNEIMPSI